MWYAWRFVLHASLTPRDVTDMLSVTNVPLPPADEFLGAVEMYREVLRSSEEHKGRLKTDSLQVYGLIPFISVQFASD